MMKLWSILICAFLFSSASHVDADFSEKDYQMKYPFAVESNPGHFENHPAGQYRVFTRFSIRECDLAQGSVEILAFYEGDRLIRSYSLKQLIPDQDQWDFHPATGVFILNLFNPNIRGVHGRIFTVLTVTGLRKFDISNGAVIESGSNR